MVFEQHGGKDLKANETQQMINKSEWLFLIVWITVKHKSGLILKTPNSITKQ